MHMNPVTELQNTRSTPDRTKERNKRTYYSSWKFHDPLLSNGQNEQTKDMEDLNKTIKQLDLFTTCRIFTQQAEHTFFSPVDGTFPKLDHMLDYEVCQ